MSRVAVQLDDGFRDLDLGHFCHPRNAVGQSGKRRTIKAVRSLGKPATRLESAGDTVSRQVQFVEWGPPFINSPMAIPGDIAPTLGVLDLLRTVYSWFTKLVRMSQAKLHNFKQLGKKKRPNFGQSLNCLDSGHDLIGSAIVLPKFIHIARG